MLFCCVIMEDREDDLADVVQIEEERQTDGRTEREGGREEVFIRYDIVQVLDP